MRKFLRVSLWVYLVGIPAGIIAYGYEDDDIYDPAIPDATAVDRVALGLLWPIIALGRLYDRVFP